MAKMILKAGADPKKVARRLKKEGFVMKQQLPDGSYVVYKKRMSVERMSVERRIVERRKDV